MSLCFLGFNCVQYMADEGLVPSPEEEAKRRNAIQKLKQVFLYQQFYPVTYCGFCSGILNASSVNF